MNDRYRWFKFWPADWRNDAALRMCSLGARGLWIECIGLMHDAEPYGHLLVNGRVPTMRQLAVLVGGTEREAKALMDELREAGVFSMNDDGTPYSRRMVRDKAASDAGKANGKRGGNPDLKGTSSSEDNSGGNEGGLTPPVGWPLKLEAEAEAEAEKNSASLRSAAPAEPSPDVRTELFRSGLGDLRAMTGLGDRQSRTLIGALLRDQRDNSAAVLGAIQRARDLRPADPVGWLKAACKPRRTIGEALMAGEEPAWDDNPVMEFIRDSQPQGQRSDGLAQIAGDADGPEPQGGGHGRAARQLRPLAH